MVSSIPGPSLASSNCSPKSYHCTDTPLAPGFKMLCICCGVGQYCSVYYTRSITPNMYKTINEPKIIQLHNDEDGLTSWC